MIRVRTRGDQRGEASQSGPDANERGIRECPGTNWRDNRILEACQSGRMGVTGNHVYPQGYRRFESSRLRPEPEIALQSRFGAAPYRVPKELWYGAPRIEIMFYVYLLRSEMKQSQLYVGYTENLESRLKKHNAGEVLSTKPYLPWAVIYYEAFTNIKDAKQREQYLKTTKGRRTLRLMLQSTLHD